MIQTTLNLCFPDKKTALAVAVKMVGNDQSSESIAFRNQYEALIKGEKVTDATIAEVAIPAGENIISRDDNSANTITFPRDGWIIETPTVPHYYCIDVIGNVVEKPAIFDTKGNEVTPVVMRTGFHILAVWRGKPETVPEVLKPYIVDYDIGRVWG